MENVEALASCPQERSESMSEQERKKVPVKIWTEQTVYVEVPRPGEECPACKRKMPKSKKA